MGVIVAVPRKRWTVVIVPHGSDRSRAFEVTDRTVRRALWGIGAGGAVTLVGLAALLAFASASGARTAREAGAERLRAELLGLRDTVATIARREAEIRRLAALPPEDSVESAAAETDTGADVDALITQANALSANFAEVSIVLEQNDERLASTPSIMPTAGRISSLFSTARLHPILHVVRPHEGIDLAAPYGTPVVAPAAGTVVLVTRQPGYGLVLEIDHGNGIITKYAHLSRTMARPGQHVTRGDLIATVGSSGLATGPHLHYEIRVHGRVVNPLTYMLPAAAPD